MMRSERRGLARRCGAPRGRLLLVALLAACHPPAEPPGEAKGADLGPRCSRDVYQRRHAVDELVALGPQRCRSSQGARRRVPGRARRRDAGPGAARTGRAAAPRARGRRQEVGRARSGDACASRDGTRGGARAAGALAAPTTTCAGMRRRRSARSGPGDPRVAAGGGGSRPSDRRATRSRRWVRSGRTRSRRCADSTSAATRGLRAGRRARPRPSAGWWWRLEGVKPASPAMRAEAARGAAPPQPSLPRPRRPGDQRRRVRRAARELKIEAQHL